MSVPVTNKGALMVVTQAQPVTMPAPSEGNHAFSRGHPLSLGATQIMIGVVILLFGIVMSLPELTLAGYSFIFVWGAVMYIIAGSLTVAAGKYDRTCLVNGAMAVSIVSTVISLAAAVLHSLDAAGLLIFCSSVCSGPNCFCYQYMILSQGFSAMLAVLHLLMMAVSITVAAFACNAICGCCKPPPLTYVNPISEYASGDASRNPNVYFQPAAYIK